MARPIDPDFMAYRERVIEEMQIIGFKAITDGFAHQGLIPDQISQRLYREISVGYAFKATARHTASIIYQIACGGWGI